MTDIDVRDIIADTDERGSDAIKRLAVEGYTLGVKENPVDENGIYPASTSEAIDAWSEDPGLVYVTESIA